MKSPDYIFEGIEDYLRTLDKESWKLNQIVQGINILQDKQLHVFVVGTENYGQAETLKLLAKSQESTRTITYNYEPFKPQPYYNDDHLILWKSPGLGRLDCEHKYLVESTTSIIQKEICSNFFIFLFILNINRFGLSYEEDFIKQLRDKTKHRFSDIDSHIIFTLNISNSTDPETCNSFISETGKSLHDTLFLESKIIPYCPDNEQSCLELKAKLLIRSAALYNKYT